MEKQSLVINDNHISTNLGKKKMRIQSCLIDSQRQNEIGSKN